MPGLLFHADAQNPPTGGGECHRLLAGHPVSEQIHLLSLKNQDGGQGKLLIGNSPLCQVLSYFFQCLFAKGCVFGWKKQGMRTHSNTSACTSQGGDTATCPVQIVRPEGLRFFNSFDVPKVRMLYGTHCASISQINAFFFWSIANMSIYLFSLICDYEISW